MRLLTIGAMQQQSLFYPETLAYQARVLADGGEIINISLVNDRVKLLKELGIWDDLILNINTDWGLQKRNVGADTFISKIYDLKDNDGVQATDNFQPKLGLGLDFDGSNNYLNHGTMGAFGSQLANYSVVMWIKTTITGEAMPYGIANDGSNTALFTILNRNKYNLPEEGQIFFNTRSDDNKTLSGATDDAGGIGYNDGNWHCYILTVTSETTTIDLDGVVESIGYRVNLQFSGFSEFQYGFTLAALNLRGVLTGYTNFEVDDFALYKKVLTASEKTDIYNTSRSKY